MHKGGLSGSGFQSPLVGGTGRLCQRGGIPSRPGVPPRGGNEKGGEFKVYAARGSSFYSERVAGGGSAFPFQKIIYAPKALRLPFVGVSGTDLLLDKLNDLS